MALDIPHISYVVRETVDKIIVFGEENTRYDILKSQIRMTESEPMRKFVDYEL